MSAHFSQWVRGCVHENAPDHSTQVVEVGRLREAARTIDELYESAAWAEAALAPFSKNPAERSGITKLRAALVRARGEQVSA